MNQKKIQHSLWWAIKSMNDVAYQKQYQEIYKILKEKSREIKKIHYKWVRLGTLPFSIFLISFYIEITNSGAFKVGAFIAGFSSSLLMIYLALKYYLDVNAEIEQYLEGQRRRPVSKYSESLGERTESRSD